MRPEYSGTDLYQRMSEVQKASVLSVWRTFLACALPPEHLSPILMLSLMSSIM